MTKPSMAATAATIKSRPQRARLAEFTAEWEAYTTKINKLFKGSSNEKNTSTYPSWKSGCLPCLLMRAATH